MQSVNYETNLQQAVIGAEANARNEYFGKKTIETVYNAIIDIKNTLFGAPNDNFGGHNSYGLYKDMYNGVSQSTSTIGGYIEYSKGKMPLNSIEKSLRYGGNAFSYISTVDNAYKLYNNTNYDNAVNFSLDISGFISFPLWWFSTWTFKFAPVLSKEFDYEGYRNGDQNW